MRHESDNGMKSFILLCIGILGLWVSGCAVLLSFNANPSTQVPLSSPIAQTVFPSAVPSRTSTVVATSIPTPITHVSTCPTPRDDADEKVLYFDDIRLVPATSYTATIDIDSEVFVEKILAFLNSGGLVESLESVLKSQNIDVVIESADLNLDRNDELLITINQPNTYGFRGIGLFVCKNTQYAFVRWLTEQGTGHNRIVTIEDLNQDGYLNYVIHETFCGSGCYEVLLIGQWKNFAERSKEWGIDIRPPAHFWIRDLDRDGIKEITVTGYRNLAPLVAPRKVSYIYKWDGLDYQIQTETLAPPRLRTHYLEDASVALMNGNEATAIRLYQAAIYEGSPTFAWSIDPQDWDVYEIAFAYFRLILIYYVQSDLESVAITQAEFAQRFPLDTPGHKFQLVVERFVTVWETSDDISTACIEAESLLADLRSADSDFDYSLLAISQSPIHGEYGAKWCPF